jgi:hypothetical protein
MLNTQHVVLSTSIAGFWAPRHSRGGGQCRPRIKLRRRINWRKGKDIDTGDGKAWSHTFYQSGLRSPARPF